MATKEVKPRLGIDHTHIRDLLQRMATKKYEVTKEDEIDKGYLETCYKLWKEDYECIVLENTDGTLCRSYPSKIIIPQYEIASRISEHSNTSINFSTKPSQNGNEKVEKEDKTDKKNVTIESDDENPNEIYDALSPNGEVDKNPNEINGAQLANGEVDENPNEIDGALLPNGEAYEIDGLLPPNGEVDRNRHSLDGAPPLNGEVNEINGAPPPNGEIDEIDGFLPPNGEEIKNCKPSTEDSKKAPPRLAGLVHMARNSRIRNRFPVPALLCNGKNVCRSSTLSCWVDASVKAYMDSTPRPNLDVETCADSYLSARLSDINLLKTFRVSSIIDLMVEKKKQVICSWITVSSSEKVDKENRYEDFKIFSLPYPGCEFFKKFIERSHSSEALYYDWTQSINDAELTIPNSESDLHMQICGDWPSYKQWDLRKLTQRYLRLIVACLKEDSDESGLLVHCISGWDRTPLFISLIRLTLWAEGLVHTSLDAKQMLFFTLAYDWFLFGHLFPTRISSDENILYFCFEFLLVLIKEEVSECIITRERHPSNENNNLDSLDKICGIEIGTPTSFGSSTSLASTSSNTPCNKVSPYKTSQREDHINWPFNKESGFTFDGISDGGTESNGGYVANQSVDVTDLPTRLENASFKQSSCLKSPLKDRYKSSKEIRSRKTSVGDDVANLSTSNNSTASSSSSTSESSRAHKKSSHLVRKTNINGFLKDLTRKSRRGSGSSAKYNISTDSVELESSGEMKLDSTSISPRPGSSSTMPVPVPTSGGSANRSRHNSSCSSIGSWQMVSTSPSRDMLGSVDSYQSSRTSLAYEMVDSTNTITEEMTPSSHGSDRSIEHFNQHRKKKKLTEVRELFYKLYGEIPELNKSKSSNLFSLYS